jgi:polysaccharide transporter, PST family
MMFKEGDTKSIIAQKLAKARESGVAKNIFFLGILQVLNLLLPLVTLPYLNRVIGIEYVGLLAFAVALCNYFQIITDYGFNLTAVKEIAQNSGNAAQLSKIYSTVLNTKLIILAGCTMVFIAIIYCIPALWHYRAVYFLTYGTVVGNVLFPVWLFQGMQRMKYITYFNIVFKLCSTAAVFIFVRSAHDYWMVPLFTSVAFLAAGIMGLVCAHRVFGVQYRQPSYKDISLQIKAGKYIFLSQLKISLFSTTNTMVLGAFAGNAAVGYFSNAEKIMRGLASLQVPVVNAIFPYISTLIKVSKQEAIKKVGRIVLYGAAVYIAVLLIVFILTPKITTLLFGKNMQATAIMLRIMLPVPLLIFINNLYGTQILVNIGRDKTFFWVLLFTAIFNVALLIPLTMLYGAYGTAVTVFCAELFLCIGMYYFAAKERYI